MAVLLFLEQNLLQHLKRFLPPSQSQNEARVEVVVSESFDVNNTGSKKRPTYQCGWRYTQHHTHHQSSREVYTHCHSSREVYTHCHSSREVYTHCHSSREVYTHCHSSREVYTHCHSSREVYTHCHSSREVATLQETLPLFKRGVHTLPLFKRGVHSSSVFKRGVHTLTLFKRGVHSSRTAMSTASQGYHNLRAGKILDYKRHEGWYCQQEFCISTSFQNEALAGHQQCALTTEDSTVSLVGSLILARVPCTHTTLLYTAQRTYSFTCPWTSQTLYTA